VDIPEIDVDELDRKIAAGARLLDVREHDEWHNARIDAATHVPLAELPQHSAGLAADGTLYVICAKGGRSALAVQWLRGRGVDAVNVAGGMDDWLERGKPATVGGC